MPEGTVTRNDERFELMLDDPTLTAGRVVVVPGAWYFRRFPEWAPGPHHRAATHRRPRRFDRVPGAQVLAAGGWQSAYEWVALLGEHGAAGRHRPPARGALVRRRQLVVR